MINKMTNRYYLFMNSFRQEYLRMVDFQLCKAEF
jgi:hypothetical protein